MMVLLLLIRKKKILGKIFWENPVPSPNKNQWKKKKFRAFKYFCWGYRTRCIIGLVCVFANSAKCD